MRFGIKNSREHFLPALTKLRPGEQESGTYFLSRWQKLATQVEIALPNYFSKDQLADFFRQALAMPFALELKRAKAKHLNK